MHLGDIKQALGHLISLAPQLFLQKHIWANHEGIFKALNHYNDAIMGVMASQITSLTIVYSTVYSGAAQSKHQSSASLAFVCGSHWGPVNSPHKWPVTQKMFPFDDVIMLLVLFAYWESTSSWWIMYTNGQYMESVSMLCHFQRHSISPM